MAFMDVSSLTVSETRHGLTETLFTVTISETWHDNLEASFLIDAPGNSGGFNCHGL